MPIAYWLLYLPLLYINNRIRLSLTEVIIPNITRMTYLRYDILRHFELEYSHAAWEYSHESCLILDIKRAPDITLLFYFGMILIFLKVLSMTRNKHDREYRLRKAFCREFWFLKIPLCLIPVIGWCILDRWTRVFERRELRENPDAYLNHFCPFCNSSLENRRI